MTHRLTLSSICRLVTYILWSSDFASYLEDYLMDIIVVDLNYFYTLRNGAGRGVFMSLRALDLVLLHFRARNVRFGSYLSN